MKRPELIYWRGSGEVRADLLHAIQVVGYELTAITDIDEVLKRELDALPGLVIVDASAGEAEASQRVIEMSAAGKLANIPIIFLSYQATKRSAVLKKTFVKFVPVDIPFKLQFLLEKLLELCPVPKEFSQPESPKEDTPLVPTAKPSIEVPPTRIPVVPGKIVIQNADPADIRSGYGGEFFALADRFDLIDDKLIIPAAHPKRDIIARALAGITNQDEWIGLHSRRVSFIASAIGKELGFDDTRDMRIRTTGLLLNVAMRDKFRHFASHDILLSNEEKILDTMVDLFKESARFVRDNVDHDTAEIIETVAGLLRYDEIADENLLLEAQCALVPELADRSTWSQEHWNSFGAHRALRRFVEGVPFKFTPEIVFAVSRIITEASAVRLLLNPLPTLPDETSGDDDAKRVADAQREAEQLFRIKEQMALQLADLKPGMRLTQPIISWDGKLILRANVSLNDDIIRKLWRLAALRPVRPPVAVLVAG